MVYRGVIWIVEYCTKQRKRPHPRYIHSVCLPGGTLCADPLILALPIPYRYGAIAQHIGSILAGPDSSPADADQFAEDFFDITIKYFPSIHGPLPVVLDTDLARLATWISLPTSCHARP